MRLILPLLALLVVSKGIAQPPRLISQERWPDGRLKATRYEEGGRIHFITYHENGKVKEQGCFRDGRRHGVWRQYSESGALIAQAGFRNGRRQGVWEFRNHADVVVGRLTFADGSLLHGEQFNEQGLLLAQRHYR